jgi:DNA-binding response OmpR family regulator
MDILVVDDDPEFLAYVRAGLEGSATVTCVQTPLEAIWFLERHEVDLLVCDLVLGRADGADLLATAGERWPAMACVLVTGFNGRLDGLRVAPANVLYKPLDTAALCQLVEGVQRNRPDSNRTARFDRDA